MSLSGPVAILGAGRAAGTLHRRLTESGLPVLPLWSRSEDSARAARADGLPCVTGPVPDTHLDAPLLLLAVSDAAISPLAASLADRLTSTSRPVVAHLSGALDLTPLMPLAAQATIGSLHPLASLSDRRGRLAGCSCAIEASDEAGRHLLTELAHRLDMNVLSPVADRARYHAAAVLAGNLPQLLLHGAVQLSARCGLTPPEARAAMAALARTAIDNFATSPDGTTGLSGPAVRGDVTTVANHLAVLSGDPALADLRALYAAGVRLAAHHAPEGQAPRLRALALQHTRTDTEQR